jgi:hypothetical protein
MKMYKLLLLIAVLMTGVGSIRAERIYGMTAATSFSDEPGINLVYFDSANPALVTTIAPFSGVVAGQALRTIDFKPGTTTLYALSTSTTIGDPAAQLYTVNLNTGVLTPIGSGLQLTGIAFAVSVAMDYDPSNNVLRVVARGGQNYRISPITGLLIARDADLVFATGDPQDQPGALPDILGIAHTNNVPGAATTTVFGWDFDVDSLVTVGGPSGVPSPNTGLVSTVAIGSLYTFRAGADIDIGGLSNFAYAVVDDGVNGSSTRLLRRDLQTGAVTIVGNFPAGMFVTDISVLPASTAAGVGISGRVLTSDGRGVTDVRVSATSTSGVMKMAVTGKGGSFFIDDLDAGQTYVVQVLSRRYSFAPQVVQLNDGLTGIEFTAGR